MSDSPNSSFRLGYRPVLDGLRAVAVLPVLLTHAGVTLIGGGNFGVDAFFVLSGFLITGTILEEWQRNGRVGLKSFYWRRAVRLLPALFLVIALWVVHALYLGSKAELVFALYVLFYIANWVRAFHFADSPGLGHTWSLSIEEQFYFVWPPLLIRLLKAGWSKQIAFWILIAGTIAVALWRGLLWRQGADIDRLYNGTDGRADALLAGCALAFLVYSGFRRNWGRLLATPCLVLLLYVIVFDLPKPFWLRDGGATLLAVVIAGLIWSLVCPGSRGLVRLIFESGPFVWTGKISYGLYLWHYPFYFLIGPYLSGPLATKVIVKLAGAFVLATLSYYFVEQPVKRWARRRDKLRANRPASVRN